MLESIANAVRRYDNTLVHGGDWSSVSGFDSNKFQPVLGTTIKIDEGPFGPMSLAESTSNPTDPPTWHGGFDTAPIFVDNTQLHRFSVWIKIVDRGHGGGSLPIDQRGTMYFGLNRINQFGILPGENVAQRINGEVHSNPYYHIRRVEVLDDGVWHLFVGHVYPVGTSVSSELHPNTAIYKSDGSIEDGERHRDDADFILLDNTHVLQLRAYHVGAQIDGVVVQFADPRIDVCNGSEPSIHHLLNGYGTNLRKKPIDYRS